MRTASRWWWSIAWTLVAWLSFSPAAVAAPPSTIGITQDTGSDRRLEPWQWSGMAPATIEAELGLGDDLEGATLTLEPGSDAAAQYRVAVQFETSLALGEDGAHLDLLDGRHCRSDWYQARRTGERAWRLPVASDADRHCVPAASSRELVAAATRALAAHEPADHTRWLDMANRVAIVGETPSYAAISTIRVRIESRGDGGWRELTTIVFRVPMGC